MRPGLTAGKWATRPPTWTWSSERLPVTAADAMQSQVVRRVVFSPVFYFAFIPNAAASAFSCSCPVIVGMKLMLRVFRLAETKCR